MTPIEQAAQALNLALEFIAEPAGMTPEIVNDKESFGEFLDNCEIRKNEVVASIRAALASLEAAKQEPLTDEQLLSLAREHVSPYLAGLHPKWFVDFGRAVLAAASCPGG